MAYNPPIKGKAIKKILSPIQRSDLGGSVDSVIKLVGELTLLKQNIQVIFDSKVEEIDQAINHALEIQKGDIGLPGQDADELAIANYILENIPKPKDGERGNTITKVSSILNAPKDAKKGDIIVIDSTGEFYIYE